MSLEIKRVLPLEGWVIQRCEYEPWRGELRIWLDDGRYFRVSGTTNGLLIERVVEREQTVVRQYEDVHVLANGRDTCGL